MRLWPSCVDLVQHPATVMNKFNDQNDQRQEKHKRKLLRCRELRQKKDIVVEKVPLCCLKMTRNSGQDIKVPRWSIKQWKYITINILLFEKATNLSPLSQNSLILCKNETKRRLRVPFLRKFRSLNSRLFHYLNNLNYALGLNKLFFCTQRTFGSSCSSKGLCSCSKRKRI